MNKFTKRALAIGASAALLTTAGVAYAYWTTTGSGDGSAVAKASNGTVTLHGVFDDDALAPGLSTPVTFTADNAGATDLYVGTITTDSIDATEADGVTGVCDVSDFHMAPVASNSVVLAGADEQGIAGTGTLYFDNAVDADDNPVNQDACKGATVTLTLSSN